MWRRTCHPHRARPARFDAVQVDHLVSPGGEPLRAIAEDVRPAKPGGERSESFARLIGERDLAFLAALRCPFVAPPRARSRSPSFLPAHRWVNLTAIFHAQPVFSRRGQQERVTVNHRVVGSSPTVGAHISNSSGKLGVTMSADSPESGEVRSVWRTGGTAKSSRKRVASCSVERRP